MKTALIASRKQRPWPDPVKREISNAHLDNSDMGEGKFTAQADYIRLQACLRSHKEMSLQSVARSTLDYKNLE